MTMSSLKRPMPPLFPLAHEARGSPDKRTQTLYQRYSKGIQKAGTSLLQFRGRDESRYSLEFRAFGFGTRETGHRRAGGGERRGE